MALVEHDLHGIQLYVRQSRSIRGGEGGLSIDFYACL